MMDKKIIIIFISFCGFLLTAKGDEAAKRNQSGTVKLFVFGDSYVDTGNSNKSFDASWKEPYGITFPGKPAGRFSDGRVLTDYLASFLGIRPPVPFEWRRQATKLEQELGMNFAYGGTGVFNTWVNAPNMSTQISNFQQLIEEKWYTNQDLNTSIAVVSLAGNDYGAYAINHGKNNPKDLTAFTELVVSQLVENLKRIQSLGVQKIAVNAMQPLGCLPQLIAYSSGNSCNGNWTSLSFVHNQKLLQQVQKLNDQTKKNAFVVLDLYNAFLSAITKQTNRTGNPLKPCCVGISSEYSCGRVDASGVKKYSVCKNPELSFFWDMIHPSQNGWQAVYLELKASLYKLF